ncbi:DUSTY-like protein [Mya arenaria]|uniref:DUSTY-like protein n=1 Tax=Mya arenaria TaxID=6604 RepID=A0ABY7G0L9_MYAAR|nr:DUSTY-like protein [Mya arenaria]
MWMDNYDGLDKQTHGQTGQIFILTKITVITMTHVVKILPMVKGHTNTAAKFLVVITVDLQLFAMLSTSIHGEPRPLLHISTPIHNMLLEIISMYLHTLVTQIVFTLWAEVLGFSVQVIFLTCEATVVVNQLQKPSEAFGRKLTCIRRFCKHCKRLNFILEDTKRCYDDINENQGQGENELLNIEMLQEEESEILSTTHKHPGILVLGQNEECKSRVVNEIFGRTIFPNFEGSEDGKQYRTVRFKYGDDLRVNLELPNDYSLLEELEAYKGPWNTIPHRDLELSAETESNTANGTAVLEVSFNHQLLRNGCTLIVAGTNQPFDEEVKRCIENVSPVLVYAFQSEKLSSQEIQDLELLKEITSFQPVCFVRIPNPDGSLATVVGSPFGAPTIQASGSRQNSPIRPKSGGSGSVDSSESLSNGYVNIRDKNVNQDYYDRNNSRLHSDETNSESDKASGNVVHRHNHVNDKVQGADGNSENRSGESRTHQRVGKIFSTNYPPVHCQVVYGQLCKIGFLSDTPGMRNVSQNIIQDYFEVDSILVPNFETFLQAFMSFSEQTMQRYLVNAVTVLNQTHIRCLQTFIICAFDMARDVLVTPKKIDFAREKEEGLYKSLFQIAVDKGDEIREMIEKNHGRQSRKSDQQGF